MSNDSFQVFAVVAFFAVIVTFFVGYWIGVAYGRRSAERERLEEVIRKADRRP